MKYSFLMKTYISVSGVHLLLCLVIVLQCLTRLFEGHSVGKSSSFWGLTLILLILRHMWSIDIPCWSHSPQCSTGGSSLDIPHSWRVEANRVKQSVNLAHHPYWHKSQIYGLAAMCLSACIKGSVKHMFCSLTSRTYLWSVMRLTLLSGGIM